MPVGVQSSVELEEAELRVLTDFSELGYLSTAARHIGVGGVHFQLFLAYCQQADLNSHSQRKPSTKDYNHMILAWRVEGIHHINQGITK